MQNSGWRCSQVIQFTPSTYIIQMSSPISSSLGKTIFLCFRDWTFQMKGHLGLRMVFGILSSWGSRSASVKYRFRNPRECNNKSSSLGILLVFFGFLTVTLASETPVVCKYSHICDAATWMTPEQYLKCRWVVVDDNGSFFFTLLILFSEKPATWRPRDKTSSAVRTKTWLKYSPLSNISICCTIDPAAWLLPAAAVRSAASLTLANCQFRPI